MKCFSYVYDMTYSFLCKTSLDAFDVKASRGSRVAPSNFINEVTETLSEDVSEM